MLKGGREALDRHAVAEQAAAVHHVLLHAAGMVRWNMAPVDVVLAHTRPP